ncbi:MAG: HDOD domain-containing protein [bacterium]|jgi:putative nucleotidyltransferase with HDIG domain
MKTLHTGNRINILETLFDPVYRAKFVDLMKSRLHRYGAELKGDSHTIETEDTKNLVRIVLNDIAVAIQEGLSAEQVLVALFTEADSESYVTGTAGMSSDQDERVLLMAIDSAMEETIPADFSVAAVEYRTEGDGSGVATQAPVAVVVPIIVGDRVSGVIAAAHGGDPEFATREDGRIQVLGHVVGGVIHEIGNQFANEERLRSLAYGLSAALDARDPKTRGHSDRVAMIAMAIINEMEKTDDSPVYQELRSCMRLAGLLHDIGKVGIPDSILLKAGELTKEEYNFIKRHPLIGAEIVNACTGLKELVPGVLYHHEHYDGSGYPFGLKGEDIPLLARVIALADSFDAITSDRPFRAASSHEEAISILTGYPSKNFDQKVLKALVSAHENGTLTFVRIPARSGSVGEPDSEIDDTYSDALKSLPTLPPVLTVVNKMLADEDAPLREVAQALSSDEGLTSRVLRLVNSAYYGLPRRISTVPLAITILGAKAVKNQVVNIAFADLMNSLGGGRKEYALLWRHAIRTGAWAKAIAAKFGSADEEEAFTAGLVHDIGKALALRLKPADYGKLVLESARSGKDLRGVEEQVLGFDHARIGAWAAEKWKLPQTLVGSIRWHHEPEGVRDEEEIIRKLVETVHLADILAKASEQDPPDHSGTLIEEASPWILEELGEAFMAEIELMSSDVVEQEKVLEETFEESGVGVV